MIDNAAKLPDVPKMAGTGWLGAAKQMGEIKPQTRLILYFTLAYT